MLLDIVGHVHRRQKRRNETQPGKKIKDSLAEIYFSAEYRLYTIYWILISANFLAVFTFRVVILA
jgi:hypothetical protein